MNSRAAILKTRVSTQNTVLRSFAKTTKANLRDPFAFQSRQYEHSSGNSIRGYISRNARDFTTNLHFVSYKAVSDGLIRGHFVRGLCLYRNIVNNRVHVTKEYTRRTACPSRALTHDRTVSTVYQNRHRNHLHLLRINKDSGCVARWSKWEK